MLTCHYFNIKFFNLWKRNPHQMKTQVLRLNPIVVSLFIIVVVVQSYSWIRTISQDVQRRTMTKTCNFSSFSPLFFITLFFYSSLLHFWIKASWNHRGSSQTTPWVFFFFFFTMSTIWIVIKFFDKYLSSLLQIFYKFTYYTTLSRLVLVFQLQKFTWLS